MFKIFLNFRIELIITILIINVSFISNKKLRKVLDSPSVNKVCNRTSSEVKDFFSSGGTSLEDKEFDDKKEYIQKLLDLIEDVGDKDEALNIYLEHLTSMLFFIIFGLVSIAIWPICLCCVCCRCCNSCIRCCFSCCSVKNKKFINVLFLFIAIGAFIIGVIFSLYGNIKIYSLFKSLDNASCSIFKIIFETISGQETENKPKWGGIDGVNEILLNLGKAVENSMNSYKDTFKQAKEEMDNEKKDWESNLKNVYDNNVKILNFTINGPLIKSSSSEREGTSKTYNNIIPEYVKNYGPYNQSKTLLYNLDNEYNTLTKGVYSILNRFYNLIDTSLSNSVSSKLKDITKEISSLDENFDKLTEDIANPWMTTQDKIINYGQNIGKAIFFLAFFSCLCIIIVLICLYCKLLDKISFIFKLVFYLSWNLLFLFTILVFVISGLIGVLGLIGKDFASVAHFIFSEENLISEKPRVLKSGKSSEYLNVCVNGNGDLKKAFGFEKSMDDLDELYNLGDDIRKYQENITSKTSSLTISAFNLIDYKNKYLHFKYYDSSGNDQNLYSFVDEMNKYTKYDDKSYQIDSVNFYNEIWSIEKTSNGYSYENVIDSSQTNYNSKKLLYIYDNWNKENLNGRYSNPVALNSLASYQNVNSGVTSIKEILDKLKDENSKIYSVVSNQNSSLNEKYSSIITVIINALSSAVNALNPLTDVLSEFLGDGYNSIYSIMNCAFIGYDVKFLLKQLYNGLGHDFYSFGSSMISMAVFLSIGIYFSVLHLIIDKDIYLIEKEKTQFDSMNLVGKKINY